MLVDQVWSFFAEGWQTPDMNDVNSIPLDLQQPTKTVLSVTTTLVVSMMKALFAAVGINVNDDMSGHDLVASKDIKDGGY
ncbi:hypothetical protein E4U21_007482 [Claviceps maximensis]|nr:hypothetical protein E4U21_007482 [Claviceps maximensis]